jgi:hypothetical protein
MRVAIYARVSTDKQDNETSRINTATPEVLKTGKRWRFDGLNYAASPSLDTESKHSSGRVGSTKCVHTHPSTQQAFIPC